VSSSIRQCREYFGEGSFKVAYPSNKLKEKVDEETFEVLDDTTVERAIELYNRGLAI